MGRTSTGHELPEQAERVILSIAIFGSPLPPPRSSRVTCNRCVGRIPHPSCGRRVRPAMNPDERKLRSDPIIFNT